MDIISISSSPSPEPVMPLTRSITRTRDEPTAQRLSLSRQSCRVGAVKHDDGGEVIVISDDSSDSEDNSAIDVGGSEQVRVKASVALRRTKKRGMASPQCHFVEPINGSSLPTSVVAGPSRLCVTASASAMPALPRSETPRAPTETSIRDAPETATTIDADDDFVVNQPTETPDSYLSRILEVVPDVDPQHVNTLIANCLGEDNIVGLVLHSILEDAKYPKAPANKGKRKRSDEDEDELASAAQIYKSTRIDYASEDRPHRGGIHYNDLAMTQLLTDFPTIPKPYIRQTLAKLNGLYAPAHILLLEQFKSPRPPFKLKANPTRCENKGKLHDAEFAREREWLLQYLDEIDDGECEDGIECGCCFSTFRFDKMVQCPDTHLFCKPCLTSYVATRLGEGNPHIRCMDISGCTLAFSESELSRVLTSKLLSLYHRTKQVKEIEDAGLEGLESCPFCEYKCVIEGDTERLFRCESEECGVVSCRSCKKVDHLPKSCKEAEEDKGVDARHRIEEAMTEALKRECPKCKQSFVKQDGCNKMTCPKCGTLSCYVCRKAIDGYQHFDQMPGRDNKKKCPLHDPVDARHDREIAEARAEAIEAIRRENPGVDDEVLNVELPKAAPVNPPPYARMGMGPWLHHHRLPGPMNILAGAPQAVGPGHVILPLAPPPPQAQRRIVQQPMQAVMQGPFVEQAVVHAGPVQVHIGGYGPGPMPNVGINVNGNPVHIPNINVVNGGNGQGAPQLIRPAEHIHIHQYNLPPPPPPAMPHFGLFRPAIVANPLRPPQDPLQQQQPLPIQQHQEQLLQHQHNLQFQHQLRLLQRLHGQQVLGDNIGEGPGLLADPPPPIERVAAEGALAPIPVPGPGPGTVARMQHLTIHDAVAMRTRHRRAARG